MDSLVQLNELFVNREQIKILTYFLNRPTKKIVQKELINTLKLAKGTVIKWLKFLTKNNFIEFESIGLNKLYILNNDDLLVKELKRFNIILKLRHLIFDDCKIYLYGSCARGDYDENSDVDLLIIGAITKRDVVKKTDAISKSISRQVNLKIFTEKEWAMMSRKDPAYFTRVEQDRIQLK